jgi:hypothetical protein
MLFSLAEATFFSSGGALPLEGTLLAIICYLWVVYDALTHNARARLNFEFLAKFCEVHKLHTAMRYCSGAPNHRKTP